MTKLREMGWRRVGPVAVGLVTALAVALWALTDGGASAPAGATGHRYLLMGTDGQVALGEAVGDLLVARHGGRSTDAEATERVQKLTHELVYGTVASTSLYELEIELLADSETPGVYAVPGGRILVTAALVEVLSDDDELAAVLAEQIGLVVHDAPTHALAEAGLLQAIPHPTALATFDVETAAPEDREALEALASHLESVSYPRERELRAEQTALEVLDQSGHDVRAVERAARTLGREPRLLGARFDLTERLDLIREAFAARDGQSS